MLSEAGSRDELRERKSSFSLSNIKAKFLVSELVRKIKYLAPPFHLPYRVEQAWERAEQLQEKHVAVERKETLSEEISSRHSLFRWAEVGEGILQLLFLWMVSVAIVFQEQIWFGLSAAVLTVAALKVAFKGAVLWTDRERDSTYQVHWVEDFLDHILLMATAAIMLLRDEEAMMSRAEYVLAPFCILVCFYQIKDIGKKFLLVTLLAEQYKKRKELRIIELFGFTIAMAHLFALIMYKMAALSTSLGHMNWLEKGGIQGESWERLYIYSYYWANTTMVTVGYGDFTPANYIEACVVTVIEIVGTAIFGYMINVIGITVNQIQKKTQQFEEYQSTVVKLQQHYQLSRELCFKMKNDIKEKESLFKSIPLKNNEQKQFLNYIQPSLKEQFVLQTNMRVIKKSIFFLTHFTVNFQNEIALRLIRFIYKPQQVITLLDQNHGRQLLIINNGVVDLFALKHHNNLQLSQRVRTIQPKEGKPTLNVYGFSSLILDRSLPLKAITRETAAAYILKQKDVLECIAKNLLDFESFSELKERMVQNKQPQQVEAPSIRCCERHFLPNIFILMKKVKNLSQSRTNYLRYQRRMPRKVVTMRNYQHKTLLMIDLDRDQKREDDFSMLKQPQIQPQPVFLDQAKNFQNFLPAYNLQQIATQYQSFCIKNRVQKPKAPTLYRKRREKVPTHTHFDS